MTKDKETSKRKEIIHQCNLTLKKLEPVVAGGDLRASEGTAVEVLVKRLQYFLPIFDNWGSQPIEAAKAPRPNALSRLISEIIEKYPEIDVTELLNKLKLEENQGVIETITDGEEEYDDQYGNLQCARLIEWTDTDGTAMTTPVPAIKDRLVRVRRTIKKT